MSRFVDSRAQKEREEIGRQLGKTQLSQKRCNQGRRYSTLQGFSPSLRKTAVVILNGSGIASVMGTLNSLL